MNGRTGGAAGFAPTFSGIISHHCMPELNAPRAARGILWPCAWALAATCVLGVGFSAVPWPLGDVYPNLHRAVTLSWR
jgi:predicted lysophospholipase L1 biosynthesis ABC-type transport system permease subunit